MFVVDRLPMWMKIMTSHSINSARWDFIIRWAPCEDSPFRDHRSSPRLPSLTISCRKLLEGTSPVSRTS